VFAWNGVGRKASVREDTGRVGRRVARKSRYSILAKVRKDGIIEDEDAEEETPAFIGSFGGETGERWTRVVRCAIGIAQTVDGFRWVQGTRDWRIEGALEHKVQRWKEEARIEQEADEKEEEGRRCHGDRRRDSCR
jgi:hypothetical protein